MWVGVCGVGPFGVEDGNGRRHFVVRHMVVADDEVDAKALGVCNLVYGLNAAVEHDDKRHACFLGIVYAFVADAVSFLVAVGYVIIHVGVELLQELVHQCHGCAAVDVVVAVDHDAFLAAHCIVEPVYGQVHVVHEERVVEFVEHRAEKPLGSRLCPYASLQQQVCKDWAHSNFFSQLLCCLHSLWCRCFVIPFKVHYIMFFFFCQWCHRGLNHANGL